MCLPDRKRDHSSLCAEQLALVQTVETFRFVLLRLRAHHRGGAFFFGEFGQEQAIEMGRHQGMVPT